jgi:hypothetical protein
MDERSVLSVKSLNNRVKTLYFLSPFQNQGILFNIATQKFIVYFCITINNAKNLSLNFKGKHNLFVSPKIQISNPGFFLRLFCR